MILSHPNTYIYIYLSIVFYTIVKHEIWKLYNNNIIIIKIIINAWVVGTSDALQ